MTQPPKPPLIVNVRPGETIGHALMRAPVSIKDEAKDEASPIQIPPGAHILGSDYQNLPRTHIIERRTTGIPFLDADGVDGTDIFIRGTPPIYKNSGPPPLTLP